MDFIIALSLSLALSFADVIYQACYNCDAMFLFACFDRAS